MCLRAGPPRYFAHTNTRTHAHTHTLKHAHIPFSLREAPSVSVLEGTTELVRAGDFGAAEECGMAEWAVRMLRKGLGDRVANIFVRAKVENEQWGLTEVRVCVLHRCAVQNNLGCGSRCR